VSEQNINVVALAQLAEVKGQLQQISQQLHMNSEATNRRIDDLRHSVEGRLAGHESRLGTLERNERGTAIRVAGIAAGASALVSAAVALAKGAN
jgi:hypothetical protein